MFRRRKYESFTSDQGSEVSVWREAMRFIGELFRVILISLIIIIPIRYFIIQPFYVKGASMEPNFLNREYLIINEIGLRFNSPVRGDVVVFRYPLDPREHFIKRIIGLPGESVDIDRGQVIIYNQSHPDGRVLVEPYINEPTPEGPTGRVKLGEEEYYLLGDNRDSSLDSRLFGGAHSDSIIGKTWLRGWPLDRLGSVTNQEAYGF